MTAFDDTPFEMNGPIDAKVLARAQAIDSDDEMRNIEARADALIASDSQLLEKLVALRRRHGLSQSDVAMRMGVSQPTVSAFEKYDSNPRLSTIRRYALAVEGNVSHAVTDVCASDEQAFVSVGSAVARPSTVVIVPSRPTRAGSTWQFDDWLPATSSTRV